MNSGVWNKLKQNVWRIVCVLLWLAFLTSFFSFQYAARYTTKEQGEDSARVAKFDFVLTSATLQPSVELLTVDNMQPGSVQSYTVAVQNKSEVALVCTVSAKNVTGNLPLKMDAVFMAIAIGGSAELTFQIEWPSTDNSPSLMGRIDVVELTVHVEQVD